MKFEPLLMMGLGAALFLLAPSISRFQSALNGILGIDRKLPPEERVRTYTRFNRVIAAVFFAIGAWWFVRLALGLPTYVSYA